MHSHCALDVAKQNAEALNAEVHFFLDDILQPSSRELKSEFDIIVSNPPYVLQSDKSSLQESVLQFEPHLALFTGDNDDLIFYKAIAHFASAHLKKDGALFLEIHEKKAKEVIEIFSSAGFSSIVLKKDIGGKDRMLKTQFMDS
jgi:release factor glutamine methyltransferase